MKPSQVKVLYIAGPTRSGSTILSNILGEVNGFFNAGELIDIWDKGLASNGLCGCGVRMRQCEVWSAVVDKAFNGEEQISVQQMVHLRDRAAHSRRVPMLMMVPGSKSGFRSHLKEYLNNLEELYRTIQSVTNCKVIVDASKNAGYAYILAMIPFIDLHIIHLIRDPRGIAFSWLQNKSYLGRRKPGNTSLVWNVRNIVTEMLRRNSSTKYLRLYYEDFVANPIKAVKQIIDLVVEKSLNLPFISEDEVELGVNHSIYGNPDRFQTGVIKLQRDERWRGMKTADKILVTSLTWPLLIRYGYTIIPQFCL